MDCNNEDNEDSQESVNIEIIPRPNNTHCTLAFYIPQIVQADLEHVEFILMRDLAHFI